MHSLSVDDIRPKSALENIRQKEAHAEDIAWLLARKEHFVEVACPACGEREISTSFIKDGFTFARCDRCKTLYMPLRPGAQILDEFYKNSKVMERFSKIIFPASRNARIEHIYKPRLERLLEKCREAGCLGGSYAEIGAGSGLFAHMVHESRAFSRVLAVEPSASLANDCRAYDFDLIESSVENLGDTLKVNVAASFEVLEHLSSPADFIEYMHRILVPDGLCILTTPNGLGLDVLEFGAASTTVGMTHLTLFNPKSIACLLRRKGFKILEVTTPGKLDVSLLREGWDSGIPPASPFLSYMISEAPEIISHNFQKFLCDNLLSSHMCCVAQKK